jgi:acetyl esterase/lipase
VDFALLPEISLAEVVDQVRRAVAWLYSNAEQLGGDREPPVICPAIPPEDIWRPPS